MAKRGFLKRNIRLITQFASTALSNGYIKGYFKGDIYTGKLKTFCVPGLNCYSCPGALGACPLGSIQSTLASGDYKFAFYVLGFLMIVGAVCGRFVCGWLCPFGLVQDLIYKIPFFKKLKKLPGEKFLSCIRYVLLLLFVFIFPMVLTDWGIGSPWFCKYVCPAGTLGAGIPLVLLNPEFTQALGWIYTWKIAILAVIILLSLLVCRPFCRYICPLGAMYGLLNPVSIIKYKFNEDKCIKCGACVKACDMGLDIMKKQNQNACIRCGKCISACKVDALQVRFLI